MQKYFLSILILLAYSHFALAQVPQLLNYQGIARDTKGNPLGNQTMTLKLSVLPTSDALVAEYEETQIVKTNEFGLYTLQIGNGNTVSGSMKAVIWETGNKYIKIAIDPTGGSNYVDVGTTQLLSVPYAMYANKAGVAATNSNDKTRTGAVNSNAAHLAGDANYLSKFTAFNTIGKSVLFESATGKIGLGTTSPGGNFSLYANAGSVIEHIRMQNVNALGSGRFTIFNNSATSYATLTKYGTSVTGGYAGVNTLYPNANLLAFGNNQFGVGDGNFLISNAGNTGISIYKGATSKLKFHADYASENVGIGGNATPISRVHFNNTDGTSMDLRLTNNTTGHTSGDGLQISNTGSAAAINNKENNQLTLGTNNNPTMLNILPSGNIGVGTPAPTQKLDVNGTTKSIGIQMPTGAATGRILESDANGNASWGNIDGVALFSTPPPAANLISPPQLVGTGDPLGSSVGNIAVAGSYAYVTVMYFSSSYMRVFDISNPANPVVVASVNTGPSFQQPGRIALKGNYAYVATNSLGILTINISNPTFPTVVDTLLNVWSVSGTEISGNYLFTLHEQGDLGVIDISNPVAPAVVGALGTGGMGIHLEVSGNYAYCISIDSNFVNTEMKIFNISNPTGPLLESTLVLTPSFDPNSQLAVTGDYAYVSSSTNQNFRVIDISNPAAPAVVGTLATPYGRLAVSGDYVYMSSATTFKVINISNPGAPAIIDSLALLGYGPDYLVVEGKFAYLLGFNLGFGIIQVAKDQYFAPSFNPATGQITPIEMQWNTSGNHISNSNTGNVGIGTTTPSSSLESAASFGAAIDIVNQSITLSNIHHTVIIGGGTPAITLPSASSATRRMYVIVNQTATPKVISNYNSFTGAVSNAIPANSSITIQSDGNFWYRIQ